LHGLEIYQSVDFFKWDLYIGCSL